MDLTGRLTATMTARLAVVLVAACTGGGRGKGGDGSGGSRDATVAPSTAGATTIDGGVGAAPRGAAEVRVEWKDAPAAVRASPGVNACGTPRRGRAQVHTLWGVAHAVVIVDAAPPPPRAAEPVLVRVSGCAVVPPVAVAAAPAAIRIYGADERRHVVAISPPVALDALAGAPARLGATASRAVLPWLGHEVETLAAGPGAIAVAPAETPDDPAWIVVAAAGHVAITDDTGLARFGALPPGTHPVRAWLPPAAGASGKLVTGELVIEVDRTTKITMDVAAGTVTPTPLPTKLLQPANVPLAGGGDDGDGDGDSAGGGTP